MLSNSTSAGLMLWIGIAPTLSADEYWQWQETVTLPVPCTLFFSAHYLPQDERARWPNARFSAHGSCLTAAWQSEAPLRVLQRHENVLYAIDEYFLCQRLHNKQWQPCAIADTPVHGFYRNVWGPIRVASTDLKALHDDERRVVSERMHGQPYAHFHDTFSEQLWLHRWCGEPTQIVHHFEKWTACAVKINKELHTLIGQALPTAAEFRPALKITVDEHESTAR